MLRHHILSLTSILMCTLFFLLSPGTFNIYAAKVYNGTVVPIVESTIHAGTNADFFGVVEHVAQVGELIYPQVTDTGGQVIKEGTVLIRLKKDYWQAKILAEESSIQSAEIDLQTAQENYLRYKKLTLTTKVVSIKEYQATRSAYYDAINALNNHKAALLEAKDILKAYTYIAPFEGIVDKIYFSGGQASDDPTTIKISQLNPIGIKINMPANEAGKIKIDSLITVSIPGTERVQGIYNGNTILCDNGIILKTQNKISSYDTGDKNIPEVGNYFTVRNFYPEGQQSNPLCVSVAAVKQDNKGYYVWKAENVKLMQTEKRISPIFKVKKVYIVPANMQRNIDGAIVARALKDPGSLELYDLVLTKLPSEQLKDGETVQFKSNRYIFMPGETVRVSIEF